MLNISAIVDNGSISQQKQTLEQLENYLVSAKGTLTTRTYSNSWGKMCTVLYGDSHGIPEDTCKFDCQSDGLLSGIYGWEVMSAFS